MPLEIEKPAPLMVGDKAYYSLSSYEPVEVEVSVPSVTAMDVEMALAAALMEEGGTPERLGDRAWMAEHFDGITDPAELRLVLRDQLEQTNAALAEEQKVALCVEELTKRLVQSIPPTHLKRAREGAKFAFEQQLTVEGLSMDRFLAQARMRPADLSAMLDQQAKMACEQNAALDAYAREKHITVQEDEYGPLLGIPQDEVSNVIEQMRSTGQYEQFKDAALHAKAAQAVVAECHCSYRHESPAEAQARTRQMQELQRELAQGGLGGPGGAADAGGQADPSSTAGTGDSPSGLHLVP